MGFEVSPEAPLAAAGLDSLAAVELQGELSRHALCLTWLCIARGGAGCEKKALPRCKHAAETGTEPAGCQACDMLRCAGQARLA